MRKIFTVLLLLAIAPFMTSGANCTTCYEEETNYEEHVVEPVYDADTDYMCLMIKYAVRNDMGALSDAVEARNAKIVGLSLNCEQLTVRHTQDSNLARITLARWSPAVCLATLTAVISPQAREI